jgi:hypothetical protein
MATEEDQTLLRVIGEILHYVWDPIDVRGLPQTRDEYDSYIDSVFVMLKSGCSESDLVLHLERIVDEQMRLPSRERKSSDAACGLVMWRDYLA